MCVTYEVFPIELRSENAQGEEESTVPHWLGAVHCGICYANLAVGYLKLARNPNFSSQLNAKNRPKDGSYLEKCVRWDTRTTV